MSRCFPFPPPGYEKKARTDEVDLLKQEKQKERKHKKDKKDKDKRESKEKREKEGRDGKHKEKKDKKEKHREKKKDKDKHKSKDKDKHKNTEKNEISTTNDKEFPGQPEAPNAGKLHQKDIKQDDKKGVLFENNLAKQKTGNNGEKAREINHLAEENKDAKFLRELDRRTRDVDARAGNQLVQKFTNANHRKDEMPVKSVAKGSGTWPDSNEKLMDKCLDAEKIDGRGIWAEVHPIGRAHVQNHAGKFDPRVDGIPKLLGKYFDRNLEATVEGKEKIKEKKDEGKEKAREKMEEEKEKIKEKKDEEGKVKEKKDDGKEKVKEKKDDKRGHKRKDKSKEKKGHGKDKDRDKEKKKEEKAKEHSELNSTEQNKLKETNMIGLIDTNSFTRLSKNKHDTLISGENLKKRKDMESNGVPRANDTWPNKVPRLSSSSPIPQNGRILEPCQISIPNASDRPGVPKVENKESKFNASIGAQPLAVPLNKTHATVLTAPAKPPHPDTKFLSQIYSVPKVEQWSDFDDQEWLFGSSLSKERKPVVQSSEVGETPRVWAEVLHIEQVDVFALPYVVPY